MYKSPEMQNVVFMSLNEIENGERFYLEYKLLFLVSM